MPDISETHETSGTAEMPDISETPDTSETPEMPDISETPETCETYSILRPLRVLIHVIHLRLLGYLRPLRQKQSID